VNIPSTSRGFIEDHAAVALLLPTSAVGTSRTWVAGPPKSVLGDEADIEVGDGRFRRLRMAAAKLL
jgi:hypothetical protein